MGFSLFRFSQNAVERRSQHRMKLFVPTMLERADGPSSANLLNISRAGALIELRCPPSPSERLILRWEGRRYEGLCRWSKGRRCGVEFEQALSTADMAMLLSA